MHIYLYATGKPYFRSLDGIGSIHMSWIEPTERFSYHVPQEQPWAIKVKQDCWTILAATLDEEIHE